jgi:hypothetical protein
LVRTVIGLAAGAGLLLAAAASLLFAGGANAAPAYHSPGYRGTRVLPHVAPVPPSAPLTLGTGSLPHLFVDAAGTGHIAWTTNPPGGESVLHYCRLNRGQPTCSAKSSLIPPANDSAGGNGPATDVDFAGPYPFAIGNELLLLDNRCCNRIPTPDGSSSDGASFLYTSEDGGSTLTGPGILGTQEPGGPPAVFGGDFPQIGVVSDLQTGGTFFQSTPAGVFSSTTVNLGDQGPDESIDGRVATDGTRPVVAFGDLNEHVYVREYSGTGDINTASNWSVSSFTGEGSRLVGGPSGVWIAYRPASGAPYRLRRIVGGVPSSTSAPITPTSGTEGINDFQLFEGASGRLTAGWLNSGTPGRAVIRTSTAGVHWSPEQVVAQKLADPSHLELGAGPDGGGFAAFEQAPAAGQSLNRIAVAPFGAIVATGQKGLGNLDGGGLGGLGGDSLASASCTDVHFGAVDALAESGCFLRDPRNPTSGAAVTQGNIRLNGLEIIPDAGATIAIDPRQHSIDTTGSVSVVLRAPLFGDLTIWHGELHAKLPGALAGVGQTLFEFDTNKFATSLKGFPLDGMIEVQIKPGGAVAVPISLQLPAYLGGISGGATLLADNTHGLRISSVHIGVQDLVLGALEIKDLNISYSGEGDVWKGGATLNIPAGTPYFGITVAVEFDHGDFTMGSFNVMLPYPGVPIFTDAYLAGFGGGFDIHPPRKTFFGNITVGGIPLDPPNYAITVNGKVSITFVDNGPVIVTVEGTGALHGFQIATAKLVFQTNGYFEVDGNVNIDLGVAALEAGVKAFIDLPAKEFSSELQGHLTLLGYDVASADSVISSKGVGACGSAFGVSLGIGYLWGGSVDVIAGIGASCDLSQYVEQPVSNAAPDVAAGQGGARQAHAAAAGIPVAVGAPFEDVAITGAGGVPTVVLTDPAGRQISPSAIQAVGSPAVALPSPSTDTTYVMLRQPVAGSWRVSAAPGSVPITAVKSARGYARPAVTAQVTGHGHRRTLHYAMTARPGLSVTFAETGPGLYHVISTVTGARGTVAFSPANGSAGVRHILALVSEQGVPRMRLDVARYIAPGPLRPGRPSGLKIARHGHSFVVSFRAAPNAAYYLVRVTASDGRHLVQLVRGSRLRLTLPVVGYHDHLTATVLGVSRLNRRGPAVRARGSA